MLHRLYIPRWSFLNIISYDHFIPSLRLKAPYSPFYNMSSECGIKLSPKDHQKCFEEFTSFPEKNNTVWTGWEINHYF